MGLISGLVAAPMAPAAGAVTPDQPTRVAVVVPISVQGGSTGILTAAELDTYTSSSGYLTRILDAVIDGPATLAIDPMVISSIRLLGADAPDSAVEWLGRLAGASNPSFALSYADSDITLGLQAGSATVLAPLSLEFAIRPDRFSPAVASDSPTSTPDVDGDGTVVPSLPTTESLLAWNYTLEDIAWPVAGTVTSTDITAIAASGFETTIVSSGNVRRPTGAVAAATSGGHSLLVTDDDASAELRTALDAKDTLGWQQSVATLTAAIDVTTQSSPAGSSLVLAVDRGQLLSPARLRTTISALGAAPHITMVGLPAIASLSGPDAELRELPQLETRVQMVSPLLVAESLDAAFATVATNPALITGERRVRLLAALAPHWNRYFGGWGIATQDYLADSVALRSSVRVVEGSEITFAADRGLLPITVENGLSQGVTVTVTVRPRTPLLAIENTAFELEIEPDSQRKALVPAEALSNGTVTLEVSIRSADGTLIGSPALVTTRVQAGWETPVTIVLGVIVLLIFAIGLYRTIRRRRLAAAEVQSVAPGEAQSGTPTNTPADQDTPA